MDKNTARAILLAVAIAFGLYLGPPAACNDSPAIVKTANNFIRFDVILQERIAESWCHDVPIKVLTNSGLK
jgi:hypothetical protein